MPITRYASALALRAPSWSNTARASSAFCRASSKRLARHVHLGVIDEAEALQIHVADPLGKGAALPEVTVRRVNHPRSALTIRGCGRRARTVVVAAVPVRVERLLVPCDRFVVLAPDVREDTEVLLHTRAHLALSAELEGLEKRPARVAGAPAERCRRPGCSVLPPRAVRSPPARHLIALLAERGG